MVKSFGERFADLQAFRQRHGHVRVRIKHRETGDASLVNWCLNARTSYRQIQEGTKPLIQLTPAQIRRMEAIGFEWRLTHVPSYQMGFDKLVRFKAEHGHCNVPSDHDDIDLVRWCEKQRRAYTVRMAAGLHPTKSLANRRFKLTLEKIEHLEDLGFKWKEPVPSTKKFKKSKKLKISVVKSVRAPEHVTSSSTNEKIQKRDTNGPALKERSTNVKDDEATNHPDEKTSKPKKKDSQIMSRREKEELHSCWL